MKGIGGFYYVSDKAGAVYECKARGKFRREKVTPMVGDIVEFEKLDGYDSIEQILPRRNFLLRPAVANIDSMILVLSAGKPEADLFLCDKLLIQAEQNGIAPVIVINKAETAPARVEELKAQYMGYDVIITSAKDGVGIDELKEKIRGMCVCFAGQSAVGKSSLINTLEHEFDLEIGELSKKTDRGKHTTREVELLYVPSCSAYVVDTPGFSMYDSHIDKAEVSDYYPELRALKGECRFSSCVHDKEPDCAVKAAVEAGKISKERYDRYLRIIHLTEEK
ncbi:MAG: ribosome small subunit-dependent GTPase A [Christensenella sp.]